MRIILFAALMLCNITPTQAARTLKAGGTPAPNELVIGQTKRVIVKPLNQSTKTVIPKQTSANPTPAMLQSAPSPAAPAGSSTATAAEPTPNPWKLSYFGEYVGPRLSNIDLTQTQSPDSATSSYTGIDHGAKLGYAISPSNILGVEVRANSGFDPTAQFFFKNMRFYLMWKNMVDTKDINITVRPDIELPTTDRSRAGGMLMAFNLRAFWTIKTELRNWSFTALTLFRPSFYNNPLAASSDFFFGLFPWVTMDLSPNWQLLFDGGFDFEHAYSSALFEYSASGDDYMNIGVLWSINSHFQLNPAFRFFISDISFKKAALYLSLSASL